MIRKILKSLIILIAVVLVSLGLFTRTEHIEKIAPRDYEQIRSTGVIHAVTEYNNISYKVEGDTIVGFDYELLHAFAQDKGLKVEITPEMSFEQRVKGLTDGRYDIMATGTLVTSALKDTMLFTKPLQLGNLILVQRKKEKENDSIYISNLFELQDKTIHVVKDSPTHLRLRNLMNEIAYNIHIEEIEKYTSEQLIALVAAGDIDYTVCNGNLAQKSLDMYGNIDINTKLSFTQIYSWGVNKNAPALLDSLNCWLENYMNTKEYKTLYRKYFN